MPKQDCCPDAGIPTDLVKEDWTRHFTAFRLGLVIVVMIFIQYPEVVLGTHSFFHRDFGLFTFPLAHHVRDSLWHGEVPLWNPLNNCGIPLLAQWNPAICYPPSLFYVAFPLPWSLNYFVLGHLVLAGLAMYGLAFRWTGNRFAASVAGLAYAMNGLSFNCLMWGSNLAALAWMPLVVLWVERGWREGRRPMIMGCVIGAVQMLSGAPEIILITWVFLGGMWLFQAGRKEISISASLGRLSSMVVLVFCLSAVQLLPFLQFFLNSGREAAQSNSFWSMPIWGWANFLVPLFHCERTLFGPYIQADQQWTSSYYPGVLIIALAMLGVLKRTSARARWLGVFALAGMVMALGEHTFVYSYIITVCPPLAIVRFPVKYVAATIFALPLLAAFGWLWIQGKEQNDPVNIRKSLTRTGACLAATVVGIILVSRYFPAPRESWQATATNGLTRAGLLVFGLLVILQWVRTLDVNKLSQLGAAFLLLLAIDAITHTARQNPTITVRAFDRLELPMSKTPKLGESRAMLDPRMERLLKHLAMPPIPAYYVGMRDSLYQNCNLPEGVPKVGGFSSLHLRDEAAVQTLLVNTNLPTGLADFLSVSQISSADELYKWLPRTTQLPWASAGQRPVFADKETTLRALAEPAFNPRTTVYVPLESSNSLYHATGRAEIVSTKYTAHRIELEVAASETAMVVLAQAYYPAWRATVSGSPAVLWRANLGFQALHVPPGHHRIILRYTDTLFRIGGWISALALLSCGLRLWFVRSGKSGSGTLTSESPPQV